MFFKNEVERLLLLGFLEISKHSKWGAQSFAQPKPESNQVVFLSEFRNINKQLKRTPYPMPKIKKI